MPSVPDNPKGIATWDDLLQEGVEVITPNPLTSGGARWNIMAAYGAQLEQGKTEEEALEYLRQLFSHVPVLDKSARESLATFAGGKGDVLIAYENEAITAQQKGEQLEYIVPDQTILIENPVAVVAESANPEKARAFIDFLRTPEAQRIFGEKGYRPIVPEVLAEFDYPDPRQSLHHRRPRRVGRGDQHVLRPGEWSRRPDRAAVSSTTFPVGAAPAAPTTSTRKAGTWSIGNAPRDRGDHHLSERDRAHPAGRGRFPLDCRRLGRVLGAVTSPQALAALRLSLVGSFVVAAINAVMGTIIAWVLVRDEFPGKDAVNA